MRDEKEFKINKVQSLMSERRYQELIAECLSFDKKQSVAKEFTLYWPRTKLDWFRYQSFIDQGLKNMEIYKAISDPLWRTQLVEFWGRRFCAACDSLISTEWCSDCGESLSWRDGFRNGSTK